VKTLHFWTRLFIIAIVAVVLFSSAAPVFAAPPINWDKLDPALAAALKAQPGKTFPIIVEAGLPNDKSPSTGAKRASEAVDHIRAAGGRARNQLAIIGGSSAQGNWDAIAKLSHNGRVRKISLDRVISASGPMQAPGGLASVYTQVVRAPEVWAMGYIGRGVGIAILDSGVYAANDIGGRMIARVDLVDATVNQGDPGGHGTHVAGIAAGNGMDSTTNTNGMYKGIAPGANIISVRVINNRGQALASTVIRGIQWVVQNRNTYNIRVLNVSLGSLAQASYKDDPVVTAAEVAWHSGILVVSAAGNRGPAPSKIDSPGIDPYSVTVGALDDNMTVVTSDDVIASFSSRGPTPDNFAKPDLVAPGRKIIALRSPNSYLVGTLTDRDALTTGGVKYFRLSGTSQATPVVSGVAALMLEKNPSLKPNQLKYILKNTARPLAGVPVNTGGRGVVDAYAAATSNLSGLDNQGLRPTDSFAVNVYPLVQGQPLVWKDPYYMGINWSNLSWDNLSWDNLSWDNLSWDNLSWDNLSWDNLSWDNLSWDATSSWDSIWSSSEAWQSIMDLD